MITLRTIDGDLLIGKFETIKEILDYFKWSYLYDGSNRYIDRNVYNNGEIKTCIR